MKSYLSLLKTLLKVNFNLTPLRHRWFREKRDRWQPILIGVAVPLGAIPLYALLFMTISFLHNSLRPLGLEYMVVTLMILFTQILILLFGFFYFVSAFYYSHDSERLLALPLKPGTVLAAKFSLVLVNEYLSTLPLLLPALIQFGLLQKASAGYWGQLVPVLLLAPIVPLTLAALLVLVLMRFVNLGRKKDLLIIIGSILLFLGVMYAQVMLGRSASVGENPQAALRLFTAEDGLIRMVGDRFPPSVWATRMLRHGFSGTGIESLLLLCATALLAGLILVWTGRRIYFRGLIGLQEAATANGNRPVPLRFGDGPHPLRALFAREWRVMNRTPIFFLNGTLTVVILPVMFTMMIKLGGQNDGLQILNHLFSSQPYVRELAMAIFLVLCAALNGTAASAVSREGSRFWISRTIPVSPRRQIGGKFLHGAVLATIGLIMGLIALGIILHPPARAILSSLLLAIPISATFLAVGLLVDLWRPLLTWTNPIRAIKQNFNVLIAMLIDVALLFSLGLIWPRGLRAGIPPGWLFTLYGCFFTIACGLIYFFVLRLAVRRYRNIEP